MLEQAIELLHAMGIWFPETDPLLLFSVNLVTERILNETNQAEIPEGLTYIAVEMIVGEYLKIKKSTGTLDVENIDLNAAIRSIQEGDTNITFAIGEGTQTAEQRLDSFIDSLTDSSRSGILRYRKMVW